MKIATWNVNSLKARKEHVLRWLAENKPAVLMIQELKGTDFPTQDIESAGYHAAFVAQKAYNGVAILSRVAPEVVCDRLPGDDSDDQARYLEVTINGIRLINIYAPNGNPVDSEKFLYKQAWLARLKNRLTSLRAGHVPFLVGGDFNIIPADGDCHDPKAWSGDALFRPESRAAFRALCYLGLTDAFRVYHPELERYTFWDYQAGAWPKNHGIRIDHFLLSPALTDKMSRCTIDPAPRGWDKPSDHVPVVLEIEA